MKAVLLILLLLGLGWAHAEADPRMTQLEAEYNRLHQEQQAVYQQFQMAQELRHNELQEPSPSVTPVYSAAGVDNTRSIDYDENVRLQQERQDRLQRYDRDISQAYARYQELGIRKRALLDQMMRLGPPASR